MYLEQETQSGTYSAGVENESEQQDWGGGGRGHQQKTAAEHQDVSASTPWH